ncbi:MAG: hypothetical protein ABI599_14795 [Flavobacteriales bacterium]
MSDPTPIQYETDPDKIDWMTAYQDQQYRWYLAGSMVGFGAMEFKRARIIGGLSALQAIHEHVRKGIISMDTAANSMHPFILDWMNDEVRICTFFENYMKAKLLSMGAVIHTFKNSAKGTPSHRLQKALRDDPMDARSLVANNITNQDLSYKTISMSLMLSESYQKAIELPQDVLQIVRQMNRSRNKLHLKTDASGEMGLKTLDDLKLLDVFVDAQIERLKKSMNR